MFFNFFNSGIATFRFPYLDLDIGRYCVFCMIVEVKFEIQSKRVKWRH